MLEEVAHDWHLGYLGVLGLLGAIGLLSLHVDVWRLIFLKLSLPRDGVRGCSAPCNSILYVRSFFKNGTDLTVYVITSVCTCFISKWGIHKPFTKPWCTWTTGYLFLASIQVANAGCMCSVIVYFLHCICVCDCDSRYESLIMLSHNVMVRHSHLLARCYLGTMCMCTTPWSLD
jgi:hypothetical protein